LCGFGWPAEGAGAKAGVLYQAVCKLPEGGAVFFALPKPQKSGCFRRGGHAAAIERTLHAVMGMNGFPAFLFPGQSQHRIGLPHQLRGLIFSSSALAGTKP